LAKNERGFPIGRWKVSIIRTGGVGEYMKSDVDEELAWKMSVVAAGENVELSKVVGEVVWARALEFEYPLSDLDVPQIEELANAYIKR